MTARLKRRALQRCVTGRRQFLTRSVAGGLAIALGGALIPTAARADDDDKNEKGDKDEKPLPTAVKPTDAAQDGDLVIKPSDYPELAKVGGFVTLDTKAGKIVVARVSEAKFVAVGAVCTHKGGPIKYDGEKMDFIVPGTARVSTRAVRSKKARPNCRCPLTRANRRPCSKSTRGRANEFAKRSIQRVPIHARAALFAEAAPAFGVGQRLFNRSVVGGRDHADLDLGAFGQFVVAQRDDQTFADDAARGEGGGLHE